MKTVTFCGHSNLPPSYVCAIKKQVYDTAEKLIQKGACEFLLGGYGDFDILCARVVGKLKIKYPHITSVLVIPYMGRDYNRDLYDCSEYPPLETVPKRFAISKRNEFMVDKADVVIALVITEYGGAYTTLRYAVRRKKEIIHISVT